MKRRLFSLLLVALLVVSILPVTAFAANPASITSVTGTYADEKLTSVTVQFTWGMSFGDVTNAKAVLQTALLNGQKVGEDPYVYGDFSNLGAIAGKSESQSAADYGFIRAALVNDNGIVSYVNDSNDVTLSVPGGLAAGTYYVYLWVTYMGEFYPDCLLCVINVAADGTATYTPAITGELRNAFSANVNEYQKIEDKNNPNAPAPTHTPVWTPVTVGKGTKDAATTVTCTADNCGAATKVSLTASDVTLPGNVFNAVITVEELSAGTATLSRAAHSHVSVSQTPGYKYSADGTNYQDINPATFEPKQGYYQASIMIMDGNTAVENLFVHYTVSDPVVTAATGDNRPIELMVAGMALFSAVAAVAFVVDRKRSF